MEVEVKSYGSQGIDARARGSESSPRRSRVQGFGILTKPSLDDGPMAMAMGVVECCASDLEPSSRSTSEKGHVVVSSIHSFSLESANPKIRESGLGCEGPRTGTGAGVVKLTE